MMLTETTPIGVSLRSRGVCLLIGVQPIVYYYFFDHINLKNSIATNLLSQMLPLSKTDK